MSTEQEDALRKLAEKPERPGYIAIDHDGGEFMPEPNQTPNDLYMNAALADAYIDSLLDELAALRAENARKDGK